MAIEKRRYEDPRFTETDDDLYIVLSGSRGEPMLPRGTVWEGTRPYPEVYDSQEEPEQEYRGYASREGDGFYYAIERYDPDVHIPLWQAFTGCVLGEPT